jgi:GDPmannose 4,6-dehydratase
MYVASGILYNHESPRRQDHLVTQKIARAAAADYVLATGETHSIREYLQEAFSHVALRWEDWVETDPALVRPVDVGQLVGNPSRAKKFLGWTPEVSFPQLVHMMVDSQLERLKSPR